MATEPHVATTNPPAPIEPAKPPDPAPFRLQATDLAERIKALGAKIKSEAEFATVAEIGSSAKALDASIEKTLATHKANAHKAWKGLCDLESSLRRPAQEVMTAARLMIATWETEQRALREAEEKRLAAEAKARMEEAQIAEAIDRDEAGDKEGAAEVLDRPVPQPVVELPKPKAAGVSTATVREVTIVDASKLKPEFLIPDKKRIKRVGGALTQEMADHLFGAGAVRVADVPQVRFKS